MPNIQTSLARDIMPTYRTNQHAIPCSTCQDMVLHVKLHITAYKGAERTGIAYAIMTQEMQHQGCDLYQIAELTGDLQS